MNALVIGNGFDLAHGLPTRYIDFLMLAKNWRSFKSEYDKNIKMAKTTNMSENQIEMPEKLDEHSVIKLAEYAYLYEEDFIEEMDIKINNNIWIKYFLNTGYEKEGWIDFENEIAKVLLVWDGFFEILSLNISRGVKKKESINNEKREILIEDFEILINFTNFIREISYDLLTLKDEYLVKRADGDSSMKIDKQRILIELKEDLNDLIDCLDIYFHQFVSKSKIRKYPKEIYDSIINKIISFNYTNTYKTTCKILDKDTYTNIKYIHGKLRDRYSFRGNKSDKANNIVLGINDNDKLNMEYVYFKKTFQRIQKKADIDYRNEQYSNVIIVGHSLDSTDGDILKNIMTGNYEKCVITIYYYNQEDYEKQIINLMVIFRESFEEMYYSNKIKFKLLNESSILEKSYSQICK